MTPLRLIQLCLVLTWLIIQAGGFFIYHQNEESQYKQDYAVLKILSSFANKVREKYSQEVLNKIKEITPIQSGRDHKNNPHMMPNPATFALELLESVSTDDLSLRMFSQYPFKGREKTAIPLNDIEEEALNRIINDNLEEYVYRSRDRLMYVVPIIMTGQSCVDCHNNHPGSQFKAWKVGQTRAVLSAEIRYKRDTATVGYIALFILSSLSFLFLIFLLQRLSQGEAFKTKSITDGLTQLYNRAYIDNDIKSRFDSTFSGIIESKGVAIIMLDVDHFKAVNDIYGHDVGDECLITIATRLRSALKREGDLIARYGGEEFLLYLSNTDIDNAVAIANKLRLAIGEAPLNEVKKPHTNETESITNTASLGLCFVAPNCDSYDFFEAVKCADTALYKAKELGRNQVVVLRYPAEPCRR